MKHLFKIKFAWFPVWSTVILMLCMISVYLPVFSGENQRLNDFPLVFVNEDKAFAESTAGKEMLDQLTSTHNGHSLKWTVEPSKEMAVKDIKENKAYGALVIPANFSSTIAGLPQAIAAGQTKANEPTLEILMNEGGGQMATSVASSTLGTVASSISDSISGQLKEGLVKNHIQVSPMSAALLDAPVASKTINVLGLSGNVNKGMTPFMIVLITSITGLMGSNMIHGYLNGIAGGLRSRGLRLSETKLLIAEIVMGAILTVLVSLTVLIFVFGVFGSSHSVGVVPIFFFMLLCSLTLFFMFKMIALVLGKWGMLVMFPLNILGIFGSGGAISLTTLPEFHRFCSSFLPTRYMVDGMRALFYYSGNMEAGLGTALRFISIYFVMFVVACLAIMMLTHKREQRDQGGKGDRSPKPIPKQEEALALMPAKA